MDLVFWTIYLTSLTNLTSFTSWILFLSFFWGKESGKHWISLPEASGAFLQKNTVANWKRPQYFCHLLENMIRSYFNSLSSGIFLYRCSLYVYFHDVWLLDLHWFIAESLSFVEDCGTIYSSRHQFAAIMGNKVWKNSAHTIRWSWYLLLNMLLEFAASLSDK